MIQVMLAAAAMSPMEAKTEEPKYLYKILSQKHWQIANNRKAVTLSSEDDAFIHLSREDQLDKVIAKYWKDTPQFTVLKLEAGQLKGRLVYEPNKAGTEKYYHLYEGYIPFSAIAEAKIVFSKREDSCCASKLPMMQMGNPVLREKARELSVEEILSPEIQTLIEEMKETMRAAPGVGLAAPQVGKSIQLAVIEDMDQSHLTAAQIEERQRWKVPFHVIINPKIELLGEKKIEFFEGCLSVNGFVGVVPRASKVRVECLNERGERVVIEAEGWYARILQHEIDHLGGVLYVDRALLPTVMFEETFFQFWKGKSAHEVLQALNHEGK